MTPRNTSKFFLSLYDRMVVNRLLILGATGALILTATIPLAGVRLNMSLRAFNSDDPSDVATASKYEEIFGLRIGTYGGVIIEDDSILTDGFLDDLDDLSGRIERLDNVSEVLSLTRFSVPDWTRGGQLTWPFTQRDPDQKRVSIPPQLTTWEYDGFPAYGPPITARAERVLDEVVYPPSRLQYVELTYLAALAQDSTKYAASSLADSIRSDPRLHRVLLSEDGPSTLVLARIDLPMTDSKGRSNVMDGLETAVQLAMPESKFRLVGYSHVEDKFADVVLFSLLQTFLLTFLVIGVLLWIAYRRLALVITALTSVSLATVCTAGLLTFLGQDLTMINSMVPVVILIIGAADAIHMLQSFQVHLKVQTKEEAIRKMFGEMGWPCFLTALTTAGGFFGLSVANIIAIRDFGINVAAGVILVYLFNMVFIPATLSAFPEARVRASTRLSGVLSAWSRWSAQFVLMRHREIALFSTIAVLIAAVSVSHIDVNQYANGEVSSDTPLRADQTFLESNFAGFLGPDIAIRRKDGARLTRPEDVVRLRALADALRRMPEVDRVECYCDFIPLDASRDSIEAQIRRLHGDRDFGQRMRSMINADADIASIAVYIGDIGTSRVRNLIDDVESLLFRFLGYDYNSEQYGYWWLAQQGIMNMVRDMLFSFGTSLLIILPILALLLGSVRLFIVSLAPNLLPMLFALAFAAWTGIPIRIGTAMVLAIAIGIAVDDTIHVMIHVRSRLSEGMGHEEAIRRTIEHSGTAVLFTSVVLVAGFLSMRVNDLLAIQDMGVLAAATLLVAFLSDVYLAPSILHILSKGREKGLSLDGIRMIGPEGFGQRREGLFE